MKKTTFKLTILVLILFISFKIYAQEIPRSIFISFHTGSYFPISSDFSKIYGNVQFINGFSIGGAITKKGLFFYGKAMYLQKEGAPIIYHFTEKNGEIIIYTTQEGSITIKHFLFNLGFQYNFNLNNNWEIFPNAGINLIHSKEKSVDLDSKATGFSGFFAGMGVERHFDKIPFSLFTEFQYNFNRPLFKTFNIDYSGVNGNIGIRYYIGNKNKSS